MMRWSSIAPILVLLMLALPVWPQARAADDAAGTVYVWDSDRVVDSTMPVYGNDTLIIKAGVNISFVPGAQDENATFPALAVMGNLWMNGTSERPVRLSADESLWQMGEGPDCIQVYNGGRADRLSARNASFTDIVVWLYYSGGEFRDCVFDRCDLNVVQSAVSFVNCTFIYSTVSTGQFWEAGSDLPPIIMRECRFDGRDPSSHPPWPYGPGEPVPEALYQRTAIELQGPVDLEDCRISGYEAGIVADLNNSRLQDCTIQDCVEGVILESQEIGQTASIRGCTVQNCTDFGIFALGGLRLADTVIGDCAQTGVQVLGALLMANCTVYNCTTGVALDAGNGAPGWLLSANRIFSCAGYGVRAEGADVDITGNLFGEGGFANGFGRLLVTRQVQLSVTDPTGRALAGTCDVSWTDALGRGGSRIWYRDDDLLLDEYFVDNAGERVDIFPYALSVRQGAAENRTTIAAGQDRITVVLAVLPDLVPSFLAPDATSIEAGQEVSFLVRVENAGAGPADASTVVFLVDGMEVDSRSVPPLTIRQSQSVYSGPWRATGGRHTVEARVDGNGRIAEDNEANNNLTVEFNVSASNAGGLSSLTGGWGWLACSVLLVVLLVVVVAAGMAAARRQARRETGLEPAPAAPREPANAKGLEPTPLKGLEPAPATIAGATRIKCPKCGRQNEVTSRQRPLEIKCELCGTRLKLVK
jgi:DNA-directed RNA polymerase subunit RPC12/RpoP